MDHLTKRRLSKEERRLPKHLRPTHSYVSSHPVPITPDDIRTAYSQPNPRDSSLTHHTLGQDEMLKKSHHKIQALSQMDANMLDANNEALINHYAAPKRKPGLLLKRKLLRMYGKNPGKLRRISGGGKHGHAAENAAGGLGLASGLATIAAPSLTTAAMGSSIPLIAAGAPYILPAAAGLAAASFITNYALREKRAKQHRKQARRETHNYIEHPEQYSDYYQNGYRY